MFSVFELPLSGYDRKTTCYKLYAIYFCASIPIIYVKGVFLQDSIFYFSSCVVLLLKHKYCLKLQSSKSLSRTTMDGSQGLQQASSQVSEIMNPKSAVYTRISQSQIQTHQSWSLPEVAAYNSLLNIHLQSAQTMNTGRGLLTRGHDNSTEINGPPLTPPMAALYNHPIVSYVHFDRIILE